MLDDATRQVGDRVLARLGFAPTDLLYQRLVRVLQNRMKRLNLGSIDEYLAYIQRHEEEELNHLAEALTINETYLFREPKHFEALKKLLPEIAKTTDTVRILSAGCASGEEVYTLAITASRTLGAIGKKFEVVGVDVDANALAKAREGLYSRWSFREEGMAQAQGFVRPEGDKWRIIPRIRQSVRFEQVNLVQSAPQGPFHIVFCRNMLMYLTPENRKAVVGKLIGLLPPNGVWFLGSSETLDEVPPEIERIAAAGTYYYRRRTAAAAAAASGGAGSSARIAAASRDSGPLKVVTASASPLFRVIVRQIMRADGAIELVGEQATIEAATRAASEQHADLIVLDAINLDGVPHAPTSMLRQTALLTVAAPGLASGNGYGDVFTVTTGNASALKQDPDAFLAAIRAAVKKTRRATPGTGALGRSGGTGALARVGGTGMLGRSGGTGALGRPGGTGMLGRTGGTGMLGPRYSRLLAIGSSTGGPAAVTEVLQQLPTGLGMAVVIVQHMPAHFTRSFAERLDRLTGYTVSEAVSGQALQQDVAYVAPGGMATLIRPNGTLQIAAHNDGDIYVPNINRTFRSIVSAGLASRTIAIVMTGMGDDGAEGLAALQASGADTMVQDPDEAVVPGMVKASIALGAGRQVLRLAGMPGEITRLATSRGRARKQEIRA